MYFISDYKKTTYEYIHTNINVYNISTVLSKIQCVLNKSVTYNIKNTLHFIKIK